MDKTKEDVFQPLVPCLSMLVQPMTFLALVTWVYMSMVEKLLVCHPAKNGISHLHGDWETRKLANQENYFVALHHLSVLNNAELDPLKLPNMSI